MKSLLLPVFYMHMKHKNEKKRKTSNCKTLGYRDVQSAAFGPNTCPQPSTPLVNHIITDRLLHATPRFSTGAARFTQLLQEII